MLLKIIPNDGNESNKSGERAILADNGCLPKIIAKVFGWEAIGILFTDDEGESNTFGACRKGNKIVLLPHFSYGPNASTETVKAIFTELKILGYTCEWRLFQKASEFAFTDKVTSMLPLQADADLQFSLLNANMKRKIRKSAMNGIVVRPGKSELLHDFYELYSRNMHRLGSPALPKRWFEALLSQYRNGDATLWLAYLENKPVGAAFMLEYKGFYEACWVSTLQKYNRLYTSYGLYWEMIRYAAEHTGRHFSFGRSTAGSGVHRFKQQWGGVDMPLFWNYSHPQKQDVRKLTFLPRLWKLLPYRVAKAVGPLVAGRFY